MFRSSTRPERSSGTSEKAPSRFTKTARSRRVNVFRQDDVPISLGLIIDTSASMTNKRDRVASAALAMVKASNPQDEVFIVNFNESAVLAKEFTNDIKDLEKALRDLERERRDRDAGRVAVGDRAPAAQRPQGQEGAAGGHRRGRQQQRGNTSAPGPGGATERRDHLRHRPAGRRGSRQRRARQEAAQTN